MNRLTSDFYYFKWKYGYFCIHWHSFQKNSCRSFFIVIFWKWLFSVIIAVRPFKFAPEYAVWALPSIWRTFEVFLLIYRLQMSITELRHGIYYCSVGFSETIMYKEDICVLCWAQHGWAHVKCTHRNERPRDFGRRRPAWIAWSKVTCSLSSATDQILYLQNWK